MTVNCRSKFNLGDHVNIVAQRIAAGREGAPIMVGVIIGVRVDYRTPNSPLISYLVDLAGAGGIAGTEPFDEACLELDSEEDDR